VNGPRREPAAAVRRPPLAAPRAAVPIEQLLDPEAMLAVFRRELPALADGPLEVLGCSVKPAKTAGSRQAFVEGRTALVYRVAVDGGGGEQQRVLQAIAPVDGAFPGPELEARCGALRARRPWRSWVIRFSQAGTT